MTFTLADLDFLTSDTGAPLLECLGDEDLSDINTLSLLTQLRRQYTPEQAGAALKMARLRLKAKDKFGDDAARLFFTEDGLQQASDPLIRNYRAGIVAGRQVIDACCGIGSDSLAFAQTGSDVLGVDIDPVRIAIARYNAEVLGSKACFELVDVREGLPNTEVIFYDPARRDDQGRRIYDVESYEPPLSFVRHWQASVIIAKLSPGVERAQLAEYHGGVEFVSVKGDLKEALLWMVADFTGTKATLLTGDAVYHWTRELPSEDMPLSEPRRWLVEPDPALLRAGLVQDVAAVCDGYLLDNTIAYFTAEERPLLPWVRAWNVLDWMPFHLKRLRAYLRERDVGRVTVKKRGVAITPEELIKRLRLKGHDSRTLVLTRCRGKPVVLICKDYTN